MGPLSCSRSFRFFLLVLWLCFADVAFGQDQSQAPDAGQPLLNTYPYNQPWSNSEKPPKKPKQSSATKEAPKFEPVTPPPENPPPQAVTPPPVQPTAVEVPPPAAPPDTVVTPVPALAKPKVAKSEVSASGDFFNGQGTVTVPVGYSLNKSVPSVIGEAQSVPRNSEYLGGTISYSYLHAWYIDVSYEHGTSSGDVNIDGSHFLGSQTPLKSSFTIDDNWYQAYVRYAFPGLRGKRLSAYLRAGGSFVQADLTVKTPSVYQQNDSTRDILGNAGFGLGYSLYASRRFIVSLQAEGEGFFGERSQQSKETLLLDAGLTPVTADINNTLYGGIGRGTVRFEYRLGQANRFRLFADGGIQGKFTEIKYPSTGGGGGGTFSELLWGPYVKLGLRYSF